MSTKTFKRFLPTSIYPPKSSQNSEFMSKRKKFLITSGILSLGFFLLQFLKDQNKFIAVGFLAVLTLILFYWSLKEGLGRNMTLLTLILPFLFTLGVGAFWFLLSVYVF